MLAKEDLAYIAFNANMGAVTAAKHVQLKIFALPDVCATWCAKHRIASATCLCQSPNKRMRAEKRNNIPNLIIYPPRHMQFGIFSFSHSELLLNGIIFPGKFFIAPVLCLSRGQMICMCVHLMCVNLVCFKSSIFFQILDSKLYCTDKLLTIKW